MGAKFTEVQGWIMPVHFGNPVREHLSVRKGAGILDMTHRGKVRVSGKERATYLQRILSQDMNKLKPSSGAYSTLLDVKGKMLAYMRIYCDEDSFLIDVEPGLQERVIRLLTQYLFREDVQIEDVTERYGLLTIQGPLSRKVLAVVAGADIKDMPECSHLTLSINSVNCKVVKTSYTGEEGYDIYAPWGETDIVWKGLIGKASSNNLSESEDAVPTPFGLAALDTLRIEAGTPVYAIDMDEHTIPLEANLDKAISYDKGCYIGQETIARIKFRGHVNRTFTGFYIEGEKVPERGDKIYKKMEGIEQCVGIITSGCFSPSLGRPIALGYIRVEHKKPGEIVYVESREQRLEATVAKLPLLTP